MDHTGGAETRPKNKSAAMLKIIVCSLQARGSKAQQLSQGPSSRAHRWCNLGSRKVDRAMSWGLVGECGFFGVRNHLGQLSLLIANPCDLGIRVRPDRLERVGTADDHIVSFNTELKVSTDAASSAVDPVHLNNLDTRARVVEPNHRTAKKQWVIGEVGKNVACALWAFLERIILRTLFKGRVFVNGNIKTQRNPAFLRTTKKPSGPMFDVTSSLCGRARAGTAATRALVSCWALATAYRYLADLLPRAQRCISVYIGRRLQGHLPGHNPV